MDALQMARDAMDVSEVKDFTPEQAMFMYAQAQAYAAIAQVEATREQTAELKRVGDEIALAIRRNNQYN